MFTSVPVPRHLDSYTLTHMRAQGKIGICPVGRLQVTLHLCVRSGEESQRTVWKRSRRLLSGQWLAVPLNALRIASYFASLPEYFPARTWGCLAAGRTQVSSFSGSPGWSWKRTELNAYDACTTASTKWACRCTLPSSGSAVVVQRQVVSLQLFRERMSCLIYARKSAHVKSVGVDFLRVCRRCTK